MATIDDDSARLWRELGRQATGLAEQATELRSMRDSLDAASRAYTDESRAVRGLVAELDSRLDHVAERLGDVAALATRAVAILEERHAQMARQSSHDLPTSAPPPRTGVRPAVAWTTIATAIAAAIAAAVQQLLSAQ